VRLFLPIGLGLFLAGCSLAFFFVFDFVLDYLLDFNRWLGLDPDPRISEWLSFVLILPIGFGIGFQLPLVMLFLERIGIVELETFTSQWRLAVIAIFVVSAILTPPIPIACSSWRCRCACSISAASPSAAGPLGGGRRRGEAGVSWRRKPASRSSCP